MRRASQRSPRGLMRRVAGPLTLLAACSQPGGSGGGNEAPRWPEGTVLVCAGEPIRAEDVDPIAEALRPLGPKFTQPHLRRLALTNICLPLAAGRAQGGSERRDQAKREALEALRAQGEGANDELGVLTEGTQGVLGVPLWVLIQDLQQGAWTGPRELPGQFVLVKLLARDGNARPQDEEFSVRVLPFPYVDDPPSLTGEALNASLELVDEAWETLIPGFWRHQMGKTGASSD